MIGRKTGRIGRTANQIKNCPKRLKAVTMARDAGAKLVGLTRPAETISEGQEKALAAALAEAKRMGWAAPISRK